MLQGHRLHSAAERCRCLRRRAGRLYRATAGFRTARPANRQASDQAANRIESAWHQSGQTQDQTEGKWRRLIPSPAHSNPRKHATAGEDCARMPQPVRTEIRCQAWTRPS